MTKRNPAPRAATRWSATAFLLLGLCATAAAADAQTAPSGSAPVQPEGERTIEGRVVDARSRNGLPYASVSIPALRRSTITDAQGRFRIEGTPAREHGLVAKLLGYSPVRIAVGAEAVEVPLEPDPVLLEGLTVTSSRLDQRARRYTGRIKVLDREQILGSAWGDARNIVVSQGVFPTPCSSRGRQGCIRRRGGTVLPRVYVDDLPMMDGLESLRSYSPNEIARIEVLDGGTRIAVYTELFVERAARRGYRPLPFVVY